MGPKLHRAVGLFLDGVRDGHLSVALDKYAHPDLVEHTPGRSDGRAGIAAAYAGLVDLDRRLVRPLRGFEDGSLVVVHTFQSFGWRHLEQVSIDIFDTDRDDLLREHWGATTPLARGSRSGYSQIDGPTTPDDLHLTDVNKSLVSAYVTRCLIGADYAAIGDYLSPEGFIQHDPDIPAGAAGLRRYLEWPTARHCIRLDVVAGCGSLVATAGLFTDGTTVYAGCDLYRVAAGRIAEHWNTHQAMPPGEGQRPNSPMNL